ncbi:MAG: D-alanyl-D-alanine dipeptidase [Saprospiraceae bacterium]|nr:D-alanyl-D-alanine dipeptidase [Saprospiraceae bacterium]
MRNISYWFVLFLSLTLWQCKHKTAPDTEPVANKETLKAEAPFQKPTEPAETRTSDIPDDWDEVNTSSSGILLDIRYATTNNFTKKQIYDCARCFLRPEAILKISKIQQELKDKYGYGLKVFDCFRPGPYQHRLWDIVPNPDYVTPPEKGSMHSRGLAVDLTIVDEQGTALDMGTDYDFFGKEAHHDYKGFSAEINKNRTLLKTMMEQNGFASIRTEWWHYSYSGKSYPLDDWVWDCR